MGECYKGWVIDTEETVGQDSGVRVVGAVSYVVSFIVEKFPGKNIVDQQWGSITSESNAKLLIDDLLTNPGLEKSEYGNKRI